ncbi:hypothetical protein SDC9_188081 [bioreactor metagenome]|uniref:Uncharacterized protein n=1 Tax=bioreactor metagenome TaxID=1076179 RepID=A0A645HZ27_9ZZZZ
MGNGRTKAETSEGSIQVAAGINVNVMQNNALASIGDGIMVKALPALDVGGAIRVTSINDTDAAIKANASASKAETGVGVAVAVNVVSYQNIARIGQAALEAATLHISADIVENKSAEKASAALGQIANTLADELISKLGGITGTTGLLDELKKLATGESSGSMMDFISARWAALTTEPLSEEIKNSIFTAMGKTILSQLTGEEYALDIQGNAALV